MNIDKKINLTELISKHPQAGEVLARHGFHCLGCALAQFETLEQGAKAHGMDDKAIVELVEEIKAKVEEQA